MIEKIKHLTIFQKICILSFLVLVVCYFKGDDKGEGVVITPEFIQECIKTGGAVLGCL